MRPFHGARERGILAAGPSCCTPGSGLHHHPRRGGDVAEGSWRGARYLTSAGRFLLDPAGAFEGPPWGSRVERLIAVVRLPGLGEQALHELDLLLHHLAEQTAIGPRVRSSPSKSSQMVSPCFGYRYRP